MENEFEAFEIAMLIREIYSQITHIIGNSFQEEGLTHQQLLVIKLIAHKKEVTISELCKEMALSKGTVSGIVQRLETAGYVTKTKHENDKRNTFVAFSEKGYSFAREFREEINDSFKTVFKNFSTEDMTAAKDGLIKLRNKIGGQSPDSKFKND